MAANRPAEDMEERRPIKENIEQPTVENGGRFFFSSFRDDRRLGREEEVSPKDPKRFGKTPAARVS